MGVFEEVDAVFSSISEVSARTCQVMMFTRTGSDQMQFATINEQSMDDNHAESKHVEMDESVCLTMSNLNMT
eukprot:6467101-Amphidinium_carterae.3